MRLLVLVPSPPSPGAGGGATRMFHMLRFLGHRFEVDVLGPALDDTEAAAATLRESCRELELIPPSPGRLRRRLARLGPYEKDPALAAAVRRRLASGRYGAIQVEKPAMLPYLPRGSRPPVVLDLWAYGLAGPRRALRHEAGIHRRARNLLRLARFAAFDTFCWPATHRLLVVSELDRLRCLRERPDRAVLLIPNGVDCAAIRPRPPATDRPPVLLFTGDMSFAPNVEAALRLATEIFPEIRRTHAEAELRIVGRRPDPRLGALRGAGVQVTGEVPDIWPHLAAATVYASPHVTGAGTRTSVLEALAAGLPVVTTSVVVEGLELVDKQHGLIADDREAAVAAILRLLDDPDERRRLGAAARRLAEERYDWPVCLGPLGPLYDGLVARRPAC